MRQRTQTPITATSDGSWINDAMNEATSAAQAIQAQQQQPQPITINITYAPVVNIDNRSVTIINQARQRPSLAQCHPSRMYLTGNMAETARRLESGESIISPEFDFMNSGTY